MKNSVRLIGNIGKSTELRQTPAGKSVASSTMAITEKFKNTKGEAVEATTWVNLEFWGATADNAATQLLKGTEVVINGRLKNEPHEKGGVHFTLTKVVVESFFVTRRPKPVTA
jgi:single-strand DNA-binding protein